MAQHINLLANRVRPVARFRAEAETGERWEWRAEYPVSYRHMIAKGAAHFRYPFNGCILRTFAVVVGNPGRLVAHWTRSVTRS